MRIAVPSLGWRADRSKSGPATTRRAATSVLCEFAMSEGGPSRQHWLKQRGFLDKEALLLYFLSP